MVERVPGNRGCARHILVRRVCARADEAHLELLGPLVVLDCLLELADGRGEVGSEGTVDVRLELGQVDLDDLVILCALILLELLGIAPCEVTDVLALCRDEVVVGTVVEGEERSGCADLSAPVKEMLGSGKFNESICRRNHMLHMVPHPVAESFSVPGPTLQKTLVSTLFYKRNTIYTKNQSANVRGRTKILDDRTSTT